ncbi:WxcM-like domain-containing protein [Hymenobacter oligotrophus]|uniref:WxcM-like domain-containing protein n=1 Tax=Hymenobacter oligotrophus TaxID=2319843 RepID=A0A3B7R7J3_9BACT|nr:FdtA/QdtA family cupin domain-containing protein [Hymenobacter oligotrophus]AYA37201.1 WxcM-like domain-containing protein [Hymenobacter oligotrophus]
MPEPYLISFPKLGDEAFGYISVAEQLQYIPFEVKRTFWTYKTPEYIVRGRHAHYRTEQVLVAAAGRIIVTTENVRGDIQFFRLEDPSVGLYVPPHVWHTMQYSDCAVQLAFASHPYDEKDYIRSRDEFRQVWRTAL